MTIALGIATSTIAFSIADAELWKPLPFSHPEQLTAVYSRGAGERAPVNMISGAELQDWRMAGSAFSDVAAVGRTSRHVVRFDTAESVVVTEVTPNYLATLGRSAVAGTTFPADTVSGTRMMVMTDRAWQRLFGGKPSAIGSTLTLDGQAVAIIGVVRADHSLGSDPDFFLALDERALLLFATERIRCSTAESDGCCRA